jgi:single-stranded-DNA-specific exonuclease
MDEAGLQPADVSAMSIGFIIGPRINAAGRLEHADLAYQLLSTTDWAIATQLARELQELNTKRQELTREAYEIAEDIALSNNTDPALIFAASPLFLPGIVGLVAGRLVEQFYRPAIVVEMGEEESHGSCRSTPEFNITQALDECADLLLRHGGHAQAAGFSILNANLPLLRERMTHLAEMKLAHQDLRPTLTIDAEVLLDELTLDLAKQLMLLEPTGEENRPPVFMTRRLRVLDARQVGRDNSHLKLRLANHMNEIDAIGFRLGHWLNDLSQYIDVAYHLDINEWRGQSSLQMRLLDIKLSS